MRFYLIDGHGFFASGTTLYSDFRFRRAEYCSADVIFANQCCLVLAHLSSPVGEAENAGRGSPA